MTSSIINEKSFEKIWILFGNISNSETLSNSMIFMREDKMTSSKHIKYELEVSKNQIESPFEVILKTHVQFGVIWFIQIIFLQK